MAVRRPAILDTHILYRLVEDTAALAVVRSGEATFDLVSTHVQRDQVTRRPDDDVRTAALELLDLMRQVPTAGAVVGVSRVGAATWTGESDLAVLRERGQPESTKEVKRRATDRLLANSARREGAVLVTDDVKLTKHAARMVPDLDVWPWSRFRAELLAGIAPIDLEAAWDALRAALPRGWVVGRPSDHGREGWVLYAHDPAERPRVGKRTRECEATSATELGVVLEMARRLSTAT